MHKDEVLRMLLDSDQTIELMCEQLEEGEITQADFDHYNELRKGLGLHEVKPYE